MFRRDGRLASVICNRRDLLHLSGGLAVAGLTIPRGVHAARPASRTARSCILVYLLGGPPHQDTFDLKPDAPAEIRGEFSPISTAVPGIQVCELLPKLAAVARKYALIRSVTQRNSNHTPMIYYTLTGRHTSRPDQDNDTRPPQRADFPHLGSILAKFKPAPRAVPGYIAIPELAIRSSTSGMYQRARTALRGGGAGFLGAGFEPLCVNGEPGMSDAVPALALPSDVSAERFERRVALLNLLDQGRVASGATQGGAGIRDQAVLLTGAASQSAATPFSLDSESEAMRDQYGRHRFGQAMLVARRLAEAGVPMIAIHFNEMTICDGWDTHSDNFTALKTELLPMLDQSLSALLTDLDERGLLEETLVVCLGEFGRTPKINANAGRDHWGECSSALLAGGGIRGGQVIGGSDRHAAWPVSDPVEPVDIHATLYHCLGVDPRQMIYDELQRPFPISEGKVLTQLF